MLPFYVDTLFKDKLEGTALPQAAGLKLVFHVPQEGERPMNADVNELLIPWSNLAKCEVKRGIFATVVEISVHSSEPFPRAIKPTKNRLRLEIRRRNKGLLGPFEQKLAACQSGQLSEDTDDFVDDMRDFLDRM